MEARSHSIVEELKMLQSPLAEMPVVMPFAVPDGYFPEFSGNLQLPIFYEAHPEAPEPVPSFGVLKAPFRVPENYFHQFAAALQEMLEITAFESRLPRQNIFGTPQGYFESFPEKLLDAVRETPALPQNLSSEMPFEVPAGYFSQFADSLSAKIKAEGQTKVIPLRPRLGLTVPLMRWVAAAVLILGVTLGIQQAGTPQGKTMAARRALASIPENTLQEYVHQHADEFDLDMIEAHLPQSSFQKASPVQNLGTHEIQAFLSDEVLL